MSAPITPTTMLPMRPKPRPFMRWEAIQPATRPTRRNPMISIEKGGRKSGKFLKQSCDYHNHHFPFTSSKVDVFTLGNSRSFLGEREKVKDATFWSETTIRNRVEGEYQRLYGFLPNRCILSNRSMHLYILRIRE